jgi:serralysin
MRAMTKPAKLPKLIVGSQQADALVGGKHAETFLGLGGNDVLSGNGGKDTFVFNGDDLDPATITIAGITGANSPDVVTDFGFDDALAFVGRDFGISGPVDLLNTTSANLSGTGNVVVLQDGFANGFLAAAAIRDNPNYLGTDDPNSDAGIFVYFNTNLGFYRAVHSADLDDGGNITVLANLPGIDLADGPSFTANDFVFV